MARTRVKIPGVDVDIVPQWVRLPSASLFTIGPDHAWWTTRETGTFELLYESMVRVQPPAHATDADIEELKLVLMSASVKAIRVSPRASAKAIIGDTHRELAAAQVTPRGVIAELVSSSWYEDKLALEDVVEELLSKAERSVLVPQHQRIEVGHITGMRVENWLCYYGQQQFDLTKTSYAIVAEEKGNPERSNWLGKTSLLDAIYFAVTGAYPTDTADEWIHEEAGMGGVDLEFSSGLFISRYRARGKATRLEVQWLGRELHNDGAQRFLEQAVIHADVFAELFYVRQNESDKFIRMKPTATSDMVTQWLGIEWLQEAAGEALAMLDATSKQESEIATRLEAQTVDVDQLKAELAEIELKEDEFKKKLEQRKVDEEYEAEWNRHKVAADKLTRYEEDARVVRLKLVGGEPKNEVAEADYEKANRAKIQAKIDLDGAERLVGSPFDGKCPAFKHLGIDCPKKDLVNSKRDENLKSAENLRRVFKEKESSVVKLKAGMDEFKRRREEYVRNDTMLRVTEERIKSAKASQRWIETHESPNVSTEDFLGMMASTSTAAELKLKIREAEKAKGEREKLSQQREQLKQQQLLLRAAHTVLGRNGAQRVIADRALSEIEEAGNQVLVNAGIPLSFHVSWKEETAQPASVCEACGCPFPSSTKIKECSRCGAVRGRKVSEKLRIRMSDRSGGADDVAGLVFKLAAARWYRTYRNLGWSVFLVDEPFRALDQANVRSMGTQVGKLLEYFDASQAFVVDHHTDVLDAMPSRIRLVSMARRRTEVVEVVGGQSKG